MRLLLTSLLLGCAWLAPCASAGASDAAERLLQEADSIRSSQPDGFARLLRQLDLRSDLEPGQREQ